MKRILMITGVVLMLLGIAAVLHPTYTYRQQQQVAKIGSSRPRLMKKRPRKFRLRPQPRSLSRDWHWF